MESEVPVWGQLLLGTTLLLIFAAVITDGNNSAVETEDSKKSCVELVRINCIAFRIAGATGLFGLGHLCKECSWAFESLMRFGEKLPGSPREGFQLANAEIGVPIGIQLLLVSALLLVFATLISDGDNIAGETKDEGESQVELVRINCIAVRIAGAMGLLGICKAYGNCSEILMRFIEMLPSSPPHGFVTASAELEVSVGIQMLLASALLLVFAAAVRDVDVEEDQEKSLPKGLTVSGMAVRLAFTVAFLGIFLGTSEGSEYTVFPSKEATLQVSSWMLVLLVAALLVVFGLAIMDDDSLEYDQQQSQPLGVLVSGMEVRLAIVVVFLGTLVQTYDGSDPKAFPSNELNLEVPSGAFFSLVSTLLLVFGLAIRDDGSVESDTREDGDQPKTQSLGMTVGSMAVRVAVGVAFLGALTAVCGGSERKDIPRVFPSKEAQVEVPSWALFLLASALLLVFGMAIKDGDRLECHAHAEDEKQELQPIGVIASKMAMRLAVGFAFLGALAWTCDGSTSHSFPSAEASMQMSAWMLFLITSTLLLVFGLAVRDDDSVKDQSCTSWASLAAFTLAFLGVCCAGISATSGVLNAAPSSEVLVNGGLIFIGTALAFTDSRMQKLLLGAEKQS